MKIKIYVGDFDNSFEVDDEIWKNKSNLEKSEICIDFISEQYGFLWIEGET